MFIKVILGYTASFRSVWATRHPNTHTLLICMAHAQISVLPFTSCGLLDKFFLLSVPQFPHLERGLIIARSVELLQGLKQSQCWFLHNEAVTLCADRVYRALRGSNLPAASCKSSSSSMPAYAGTRHIHLELGQGSWFLLSCNDNGIHQQLSSPLGVYSPPLWPGRGSHKGKAGIPEASVSTAGRPT